MKKIKILDWPTQRFYCETHPFYRWKEQLKERGYEVKCYHNHLHKELKDADYLIIHSRYFNPGWQSIHDRNQQNEEELIAYLLQIKNVNGKLIWFDAADSSGSSDFPIISFVDVFLKKQILQDKEYYTNPHANNHKLRVWIEDDDSGSSSFKPCPVNQLHKIKAGWNLGLNDYRYFGYKLSRLSNYLNYSLYPLKFSQVVDTRPLDLTFRGNLRYEDGGRDKVSEQRNKVLTYLRNVSMNVASGPVIPKKSYWKELRNAKICISPFGWGEVCYRDFESFISGALLIKPSMEHLTTYPDMYVANETYIPVKWNLDDLPEKLEQVKDNFSDFKHIAIQGQERYKKAVNDPETFINTLLSAIA